MDVQVEQKLKRLETVILPVLRCVRCDVGRLRLAGDGRSLGCLDCGHEYLVHAGIPIMLLDPRQALEFDPGVMVEHSYSGQWIELIEAAGSGLVLDLGSGNTPDRYDNLIKMEIFAFPNVDVVGVGECLPFKTGSLQTVFAGAVFEHVEQPFVCAQQIQRVLREGGRVYVETAFLQPFHAYPHHFFNMTTRGVEKVFEEFAALEIGVRPHQYPSFALSWILDVWAARLSEEERQQFLGATVAEIIEEYKRDPFSQRWMESFGPRDREDLACGVYFLGEKRARPLGSRFPHARFAARRIAALLRG